MNTLEAIEKRWGCRKFLDKDVDREALSSVLDSARYAPSAGNLQDRSFIVVRKPETKAAIAAAAGDQTWMQTAPIHIVVVAENKKNEKFFGEKGKNIFPIQDTSFAVENMLLTATDLGLGVSLVIGFNDEKLNDLLDIKAPAKVHAIIVLGHPAEQPAPSSKYPLDRFVFFEKHNSRIEQTPSPAETIAKTKEQVVEGAKEVKKGFLEKIKSLFKKKEQPTEDHFLGETIKVKEEIPRQLPR